MLSLILYKQINYRFSRQLFKPNLKRYFDEKPDKLYQAKKNIEQKLSIPQIPENLFKKIFKEQPIIFVQNKQAHQRFANRVKFVKQLGEKYELGKVMQNCIYSNQYILFKTRNQILEELCKAVEHDYGFTKEQIHNIFNNYYRTINPKLILMLDQKIQLFHDYLNLTKQQSIELFAKHHFLIPASLNKLKQTIIFFLSQAKSFNNEILNRERIIKLLNDSPEIFILGRYQIKDLIDIYHQWGLEYKEIWEIFLDNPLHFNNFANEIMPLKRKLFRYYRFTKQMGILMVKKYPLVLLSSISSLETKLIFIKERLKLPINEQTLELLQYKFSEIRPKGELLVRANQSVTLENIISFIKMNDEEFANKIGISVDRLKEQYQRFKQTDQIDWRRRKIFKGSGVQQRAKQKIQNMRNELLQVVSTA